MKSFATLKADVLSELQDVDSAVWDLTPNTTEIEKKLEDAFREISEYSPYVILVRFEIESRTGTATTTTASKLVDSQGQFLSTDVGKVIYNTTDHTWATVSAYVDANTLTLTGDIMVSGDEYEMYNEGCRSNKQVYIGDVTDYVGGKHGVMLDDEHATEYPLGTKRNVDVNGDVLSLLMDIDPDDSADADAKVDVFVWFKVRHRVSQLTDLAGELTAGYAAGITSVNIDGLQTGSATFAEDTLFTIENCRGTYRVTADATIAANAATVSFFPALEDAVVNNADVTIIGSTLDVELERIAVELAAAKARISKAGLYISENFGGGVPRGHFEFGQNQLALALRELERRKPITVRQTHSRL